MKDNNNQNTEYLNLEAKIVKALKEVYDPEIPVNIYDLGLIYEINIDPENNAAIQMTLTAPGCPVADHLVFMVRDKVENIEQINKVEVDLVFDPPWDKSMMSEEALLELGFL